MWPFHRHRWVEVERLKMWRPQGNLLEGPDWEHPPSPVTVITERCVDQSCRKWRQKTLMGHLTGAITPEKLMEGR